MKQPQAFDCTSQQVSAGRGDYLVRLSFDPIVAQPGDPLVLRITSTWHDRSQVSFSFADGTREYIDFDGRSASKYLTIGAIIELPVPVRRAALTKIDVEVRGSANLRGIVLGPRLVTRSESYILKLWLVTFYSAFAGLVLALIAYNLSHWAALRHRFQLLYCTMVATLAGYAFTSSGAVILAFPSLANNDRLRLNYVILTLVAIAALQFVRHFFEANVFSRALRRMIVWCSAVAMAASLAYSILSPWQIWLLDRLYFIALSLLISIVVPVLVSAWTNRSRYFWIFVIAWSAPVITSIFRILHGFHVIGYSFWLDNGNLAALSIEALMSSIMVTMRLRELSLERDTAREGEQVARRLANTDPLTGLLNRRAFLDLAIGRRARQRLMLIDIDHFKAVNDRLGHDGGDEVLRAVANAIQSCRPSGSLAVRLGGEEFALLIPQSAVDECPAEMVLEAVRRCPMRKGAGVTVSLGYADGVIGDEEDWKRLYRLADAALYRAKSDGRDRACRSTDFRAVA